MKKFLLALSLALLSTSSHAAMRGAPFVPEVDKRFSDLEDGAIEQSAAARKYAKVVYDVSVDGGSSTATKNLGITIPANSIITGLYVYINTAFTKAGGGAGVASLALQCAGTRDLMAYTNISDYGAYQYIARRLGTIASSPQISYQLQSLTRENEPFLSDSVASVATACDVTAVVRGDSGYEAYTAGKATAIIEYFIR